MASIFSIVTRATDQLFYTGFWRRIFEQRTAADTGRRPISNRSGRGCWRRCFSGALALAALNASAACLPIRVEIKHPEKDTATQFSHAENNYGCGVAISKHEILTCHHVIEDAIGRPTTAFVHITINGKDIDASIVRSDKKSDLALLTVDVDLDDPVPLEDDMVLADTYAVGSEKKEPRERTGQKSPVISVGLRVRFFAMDTGKSGSQILTSAGKLCGIFRRIYIDKTDPKNVEMSAECASIGEIREFVDRKK